jgi:hypothetical protein
MGSSHPNFIGTSSRHDGKKFPGCLKENARPSLSIALVFFYFGNGGVMKTQFVFFVIDFMLVSAYLLVLIRQNMRKIFAKVGNH